MERDVTSIPPVKADERVSYGSDPNQFFDLWQPKRSGCIGAAVMVHGGFWRARYDLSHASHLCAALARSGIVTANLEYRRAGQAGGGWPGSFEDVLAGIKAAANHLGAELVLLGHSAGGHLALRAAAEPVALRGVVALAPVAVLQLAYEMNLSDGAVVEFLGATPETDPDVYATACPSRHPAVVRRTVIHGTKDEIVPIAISRSFVEARRSDTPPPTLIEIPEAGHMDVIDPESRAWPIVLNAVVAMMQ